MSYTNITATRDLIIDDTQPIKKQEEVTVKECISEMLRTGYCKQGIILFLERIDIKEIADGEKKRTRQAYILSLSDGAKRINGETFHRLYVVLMLIILLAVLRSEIHRFVVTEE